MGGIDRPARTLEQKRAALIEAFEELYGAGAAPRVFAAPGRVNLMGAHIDYCGGPVMPLAVDRHTLVALRPFAAGRLRLASLHAPEREQYALSELPARPRGTWGDYAVGVARGLVARGARARGLELLVAGDLPVGAGLSSSASLCLALTRGLEAAWGLELDARGRVAVALEAERGFVGVPCGVLDPFAIGCARSGHVLWLETRSEAHEYLPLELRATRLAVVDSGVRRRVAASAYSRRVEECARAFAVLGAYVPGASCLAQVDAESLARHGALLDPVLRRRAEHVVGEVARTRAARAALEGSDLAALGALMTRSHASLRDLHEVSCPELDAIVELALSIEGVHGGRMIGAGFGGCAAFLLEHEACAELEARLSNEYRARLGGAPGVWILRGDGAPREL